MKTEFKNSFYSKEIICPGKGEISNVNLIDRFRYRMLSLSIMLTFVVMVIVLFLHLFSYHVPVDRRILICDFLSLAALLLSYRLVQIDIHRWYIPIFYVNYAILITLVAFVYLQGFNHLVLVWYPPIVMSAVILGGISAGFFIAVITLLLTLTLTVSLSTETYISTLLSIGGSGVFGGVIYAIMQKFSQENEALKDHFYHLATIDSLTRIGNRRYFFERCGEMYTMAQRKKRFLTFLYIDIDNFKKINDTYEHTKGDEILQDFARLLSDSIRKYDTVGRIGGEEFALCLYDTTPENALSIAEKIRKSAQTITINGTQHLTVSIGVYSFQPRPGELPNLTQILKYADRAMYEAKAKGKNRVEIYHPGKELNEEALSRTAPSET